MRNVFAIAVGTLLLLPVLTSGPIIAQAAAPRTIYFSVLNARGLPVSDLEMADLSLTARGVSRPIVGVHRAAGRADIAVIVNDGGSGIFEAPLADFIRGLLPDASFSIVALDRHPPKLVDYTSDAGSLGMALQQIGRRAPGVAAAYLNDSISAAARDLSRRRSLRPVIVALTVGGEPLDERGTDVSAMADAALASLRRSGASLHVVMDKMREKGPVLADGPVQTGGTTEYIGDGGLWAILQTLRSQYALTYTVPDGRKLDSGLVLRTSREGLRLIYPSVAGPNARPVE